MPDLNAEQFLSENPITTAAEALTKLEESHVLIPKIDNKDAYITYLFEVWDD